jgi:hypothetical protein
MYCDRALVLSFCLARSLWAIAKMSNDAKHPTNFTREQIHASARGYVHDYAPAYLRFNLPNPSSSSFFPMLDSLHIRGYRDGVYLAAHAIRGQ